MGRGYLGHKTQARRDSLRMPFTHSSPSQPEGWATLRELAGEVLLRAEALRHTSQEGRG